MFLKYADDLVCVLAHESLPILNLAEWENAEDTIRELGDLGLSSAEEKSESLLISPGMVVEDLFRRKAGLSRKGHYGVKTRDDQLETFRTVAPWSEDPDTCERVVADLGGGQPLQGPFERVRVLKILGLLIGERFSFQEHFSNLIDRAKIRMGIISRVSGRAWGLETNVLRMTPNALVAGMLRYGLTITGAMAYEQ